MLSRDEVLGNLEIIEERSDITDYGEIHGNTYCRIIYDASRWYPGLGLKLPTNVFVKMYNYSKLVFESFQKNAVTTICSSTSLKRTTPQEIAVCIKISKPNCLRISEWGVNSSNEYL